MKNLFLDDIPVATLQTLAGIVLAIIAYISKDLTIFQAFAAVGINTAGAGVVGVARNGSGRGVKR
jgi:hypothetical protein